MLSIQTLTSGLENRLLFSLIGSEWLRGIEGILMLGEGEKLSKNYIYFCTPEIAQKTLEQHDFLSGFTLFVAGSLPKPDEKASPALNLIAVDASLPELYNTLFRNYTRYRQWKYRLGAIPIEDGGIKKLLQTAVAISESQVSFYILTSTFKLIESCVAENQVTRLSRRLNEGGYLSESQIAQCFEYAAGEDDSDGGGGNKIS